MKDNFENLEIWKECRIFRKTITIKKTSNFADNHVVP